MKKYAIVDRSVDLSATSGSELCGTVKLEAFEEIERT